MQGGVLQMRVPQTHEKARPTAHAMCLHTKAWGCVGRGSAAALGPACLGACLGAGFGCPPRSSVPLTCAWAWKGPKVHSRAKKNEEQKGKVRTLCRLSSYTAEPTLTKTMAMGLSTWGASRKPGVSCGHKAGQATRGFLDIIVTQI